MSPDVPQAASLGRILLVGNYAPEQQESMLRFACLLKSQIEHLNLHVELLQPRSYLLRFAGAKANPNRGLAKLLGYVDKFLIFPWFLWQAAGRQDIIHICDHSNSMYGRWTRGKPWMLTCNDLLAVRSAMGEFPQNSVRWSGRILQRWIRNWLGRAHQVACISSATRDDLLRLTTQRPERLEVVHMGLNYPFQQRAESEWKPIVSKFFLRNGLSPELRYVFHIGGDQWYKNRQGVVALFALVASGVPHVHLVMAGKAPNDELLECLSHQGIQKRVHFVGSVSNAELEGLYNGAECLLFPSLAEGFGWPVVEAQACGCRVATSNVPPLPEVGGKSCLYLEIDKPHKAAHHLLGLLREDEDARAIRIEYGLLNARRFDPTVMGAKYFDLYQKTWMHARSGW